MSKIYKADFEDKERKTKTISELFDSIQLYRSEGKSISDIHRAFRRSGLWKKSLSSFSHEYYQYRRQKEEADNGGNGELAKSQRKSRSIAMQSLSDSSSGSSEDEPAPEVKPAKRSGMNSEMTLEERREISARIFKQKQTNG